MDILDILQDWYESKKQLDALEKKIQKYKTSIAKEMNNRDVDQITESGFIVKRRRNTRSYITKGNVPEEIWNRYSSKSSFDAFFLSKKK
jgi:hypothetical protein